MHRSLIGLLEERESTYDISNFANGGLLSKVFSETDRGIHFHNHAVVDRLTLNYGQRRHYLHIRLYNLFYLKE